jgi:hypothetical protein
MQLAAMNGTRDYVNSSGTQNFMNTAASGVQNLVSGNPNQVQSVANSGMNNALGYMTNNNMYDPADATNQMAYGNNSNPFLKSNVDNALNQLSSKFTMETLPGLRRNAIGNGSYGSTRNEMAEGLAGGALAKQMYDTASQMYGQDYAQQQGNSLGALAQSAQQQGARAQLANSLFNSGNALNLDGQNIGFTNYQNALNAPLAMLQQMRNIGGIQYQQNQNQLNDATNRWEFNQNATWDQLGQFKNMIDPNSTMGGSGSNASYRQDAAPVQSNAALATGGLLSAAGLAASLYGK